jgi:hypothetical protein
MLDIFVVALLASLVRAGALATIIPGGGALAFASVVVLTMLASLSFDPPAVGFARTARPATPMGDAAPDPRNRRQLACAAAMPTRANIPAAESRICRIRQCPILPHLRRAATHAQRARAGCHRWSG